MWMLVISLFIGLGPITYAMATKAPNCGPFSGGYVWCMHNLYVLYCNWVIVNIIIKPRHSIIFIQHKLHGAC